MFFLIVGKTVKFNHRACRCKISIIKRCDNVFLIFYFHSRKRNNNVFIIFHALRLTVYCIIMYLMYSIVGLHDAWITYVRCLTALLYFIMLLFENIFMIRVQILALVTKIPTIIASSLNKRNSNGASTNNKYSTDTNLLPRRASL